MTLYAANVMDIAKPIEKKAKKASGKKAVEESPAPPETPVAVKKEPTEKQLAAAEKRKRKREEAMESKRMEEEAIRAKEEEIRAKEDELARKKEEAKEKRRLAREARKTAPTQEVSPPTSTASDAASEEVPVKVKKAKKEKSETEPPAWFQKYVAGVKAEEAKQSSARIPKKEVLEEARQTAQQQWNDGLTRDRIQNEVDSHMSRMYGMIFNNRRFK